MATENLAIAEWVEDQDDPHVTVSDGLNKLDNAMNGVLALTLTGDANQTLTATQCREYGMVVISGTITAKRTITLAANHRHIAIFNATTGGFALTIRAPGTGSTVDLPNGRAFVFFSDGDNIRSASGNVSGVDSVNGLTGAVVLELGTRSYDFPASFSATPAADEIIGAIVAGRDMTIAAVKGVGDTNPAATFDIDVTINGVSSATVSISTAGAISLTGFPLSVSEGERLRVVAPSTPDASIAGWDLTFVAEAD